MTSKSPKSPKSPNFIKITTVQALNNLETSTRKVTPNDVLYLKHNGRYTDLGTFSEVKSRTPAGTTFGEEFTHNLYLKEHNVPSFGRLSVKNMHWKDVNSLKNVDLDPALRRLLPTEQHFKPYETSPNYENKRRKTRISSVRRSRSRNYRVRRSRSRNYRVRRARSRKALRK